MNKVRLEKVETKLEEQLDILTAKGLTTEQKKENIATAMAVVRVSQAIIATEAVIERARGNTNDAREIKRLNERFGTGQTIEAKPVEIETKA